MGLQLLLVRDWVERPVLAWVGALEVIVRNAGIRRDLDLTAELPSWHRDVLIEHATEFCKVEPAHRVHGLEPLSDFLLEIDTPARQRLVLG